MISGKLNLAKFQHVLSTFKNKAGEKEECIVIPIKRNNLFRSEKGNVFLDIAGFEIAPEKRKGDDTHIVVQSFSKEEREKRKAAGEQSEIIGNLRINDGTGSPEPNVADDITPGAEGEDDLPF